MAVINMNLVLIITLLDCYIFSESPLEKYVSILGEYLARYHDLEINVISVQLCKNLINTTDIKE